MKSDVIFPNDKDFPPVDHSSQLMYDMEGLEERKLFAL